MTYQAIHSYEYVEKFKCIQEKCESNCCQENWIVPVTDNEVDFYREKAPDILEIITSDKGVNKIPLSEQGGCMFLTDGRCKIHAERGPKMLPEGCHDYPRVYRSVNSVLFRSAKISCPEVARICLFSDDPFKPRQLNEIETEIGPVYNFDAPSLSNDNALSITDMLLAKVLEEDKPIEESLYSVLLATYAMDSAEAKDWKSVVDRTFAECDEAPYCSQYPKNNDQIAIVPLLKETIFKASNLPENTLEKFSHMFVLTPGEKGSPATIKLRNHNISSYTAEAAEKIDHILRRYIANNMTLASLPIIPLTEKGKNTGRRASNWGQFLIMDFLITRLLLISAITDDGKPPSDALTVEMIFRLARYKMHADQSKTEAQWIDMEGDEFLGIVHKLL